MSKNIDDKLVKKAHRQVLYTAEQVEELKECLDPDTGPQYFMENFMYIQHPVKGQMLFSPYEYQEDLINVYHDYRYSIAMIGRQLGKCFSKNTKYRVRNKKTGEVLELTAKEFHELQKHTQKKGDKNDT